MLNFFITIKCIVFSWKFDKSSGIFNLDSKRSFLVFPYTNFKRFPDFSFPLTIKHYYRCRKQKKAYIDATNKSRTYRPTKNERWLWKIPKYKTFWEILPWGWFWSKCNPTQAQLMSKFIPSKLWRFFLNLFYFLQQSGQSPLDLESPGII